MFKVEVRGLNEITARFQRLPSEFHVRILGAAETIGTLLEAQVKDNIARMFSHPQQMQTAVGHEVVDDGDVVTAVVNASGRLTGVVLPYMEIHEYGGVTRAHAIFPVRAHALRFLSPGSLGLSGAGPKANAGVFATHVNHPGSRMPERSYLRSALFQRRTEVTELFRAATTTAVRGT